MKLSLWLYIYLHGDVILKIKLSAVRAEPFRKHDNSDYVTNTKPKWDKTLDMKNCIPLTDSFCD